jgi:hypothetical protein
MKLCIKFGSREDKKEIYMYILFWMSEFLLNVSARYNNSVGKSMIKSAGSHHFIGLPIFPWNPNVILQWKNTV